MEVRERNKGIGFIEGLVTVLVAISISMVIKIVLSPLIAYPLGFTLTYFISSKKNNLELNLFKRGERYQRINWFECVLLLGSFFFFINLISESEALIRLGVDKYIDEFNNNRGIGKAFISSVVIAPIVEEVLFRRLLLNGFLIRYENEFKAILLNSLLFGILHFDPDADNIFGKVLSAFLGSLIFGSVYLKTNKIWYAILLHSLGNLYYYLFGIFLVFFDIYIHSSLELALVFLSILLFVIGHKKGGVLSW